MGGMKESDSSREGGASGVWGFLMGSSTFEEDEGEVLRNLGECGLERGDED